MKKVLILAYFYPPSIFVGGQRVEYWAKHLHQFGYYPVIVTRNWNEGQTTLTEAVSNNELKIETYETHEIHRVPYNQPLRDKLADNPRMRLFQKALTFWELIASNFSIKALPYKNLYPYCDKLIGSGEFEAFIASGRPFQTFHIGHKLKKKHNVLWVPDFRDEWNSHYRTPIRNPLMKFIAGLERRSEKKWVSNADAFLSVSTIWVNRISTFNGVRGMVVKNGYDAVVKKKNRNDQDLKVIYAGTLYSYQNIRPVVEAIRSIDNPKLKFYFVGNSESNEAKEYLESLQEQHPQRIHIVNKVPKEEFEQLIGEMDIGILLPYENLNGCLPVKIFDYYAHGLELLLCPSDKDLMVEFIQDTQSGVVVDSQEACAAFLKERLANHDPSNNVKERDYSLGKEYHRLYQTEMLAKSINSVLDA